MFRSFLREQTEPEVFYRDLARDTIQTLTEHGPISGRTVLDVGAGPVQFADEFSRAGARYVGLDVDVHTVSSTEQSTAVVGVGQALPFADASADIVMSSNVMEHVREPAVVGREMIRVAKPGGLVMISYTAWFSPWGGHETSPWHYLGGGYAARRYERREGKPPKNVFGESMYAAHVGEGLKWGRTQPDAELLLAVPRYHPDWATGIVHVPVLRELASWNLLMVLRRR